MDENLVQYLYVGISAIVTWILGKISKKMNWNENLPIPIQNIFVGVLMFAFIILYLKITNVPIDTKVIADTILKTLSGSGIATLCYDTTKTTKEYK